MPMPAPCPSGKKLRLIFFIQYFYIFKNQKPAASHRIRTRSVRSIADVLLDTFGGFGIFSLPNFAVSAPGLQGMRLVVYLPTLTVALQYYNHYKPTKITHGGCFNAFSSKSLDCAFDARRNFGPGQGRFER
jgi:hypothetical protein